MEGGLETGGRCLLPPHSGWASPASGVAGGEWCGSRIVLCLLIPCLGGFCPVHRADPRWGWRAVWDRRAWELHPRCWLCRPHTDGRIQHCHRAQRSVFTGLEESKALSQKPGTVPQFPHLCLLIVLMQGLNCLTRRVRLFSGHLPHLLS